MNRNRSSIILKLLAVCSICLATIFGIAYLLRWLGVVEF
jgi:hypothetical protein